MAPQPLPEELVEEILLRFPPDDPARLVDAALVSGAGFRRRFREFHRTPPLLGFVSNIRIQGDCGAAKFVPTCSLPASQVHSRWRGRVIDAHHGRVLLHRISGGWGLPGPMFLWSGILPRTSRKKCPFRLCHGTHTTGQRRFSALPAAPATTLIAAGIPSSSFSWAMIGNMSRQSFAPTHPEISWIQMPPTCSSKWPYVLNTTEGGGHGFATILESSKLYVWSRDGVSEVDATWTQSRVIELKTLLPVHAVLASPRVLGFTVGTGVIFVRSNNVLFVIDLKTYKVIKEISMANEIYTIVPYMSFYTPVAMLSNSFNRSPLDVLAKMCVWQCSQIVSTEVHWMSLLKYIFSSLTNEKHGKVERVAAMETDWRVRAESLRNIHTPYMSNGF
ncbi:unnamed protein product [Miscanthus lutarioriparius]|uniref:F-box domain-containing protein n=1 Tax=Miscanthus lutarioriparius TaxID=422564 RepID=A0A811NC18_9POAL|nr:unnamed protein product [Miscanthus lutarioriparius]